MKKIILALPLLLTACEKDIRESDTTEYSYAIGLDAGKNLKRSKTKVDIDAFVLGLQDGANNEEPRLSPTELTAAYVKIKESSNPVGMANLKKGKAFLSQNKKKQGVQMTKTGLQYRVIQEGKGKKPRLRDQVKVHYIGKFISGTEFINTRKQGEASIIPMTEVIPGWREALSMMSKGAKYELFIPARLAFGEEGYDRIPPNTVLIYEMELLDIIHR